MATKKKMLQAAAGQAGGAGLDITDVFSTYLYSGTSGSPGTTVTNGIDLAGEGGLVWLKSRSNSVNHSLFDTERGGNSNLATNVTDGSGSLQMDVFGGTVFNSDGFFLRSGNGTIEASGYDYASWTFRKAPKFFDVVTFTSASSGNTTFSHDLGTEPAFVVIKNTQTSDPWIIYHRSTGTTKLLAFTTSAAGEQGAGTFTATSTDFTVASNLMYTSQTYVAYLFAHNDGDGGFGPDGDQDIIKCGSYTGNGSTNGPEIDLGFEPQWLLVKQSSASGEGWRMFDTMRGWANGSGDTDQRLQANSSGAEAVTTFGHPTATGFQIDSIDSAYNASGGTYIYMAIRRGPLAQPESGTEVFAIDQQNSSAPYYTSNFPVDMGFLRRKDNTSSWYIYDRLRQGKELVIDTTAAEGGAGSAQFDYMDGFISGAFASDVYSWMWKRAPGYFDAVAYTGDGVAGRTVSHNLGVAPEMMWVKLRNQFADSWIVYHKDLTSGYNIFLESSAGEGNYGNRLYGPSATTFTVSGDTSVNNSYSPSLNYIAYLFATVPGVSKVGSYTGNGSSQTIDCGFTSGARFVLIKRTDSTGDWYVWDTERGIVAGNDPYLELNTTDAEVTSTDWVDPDNSGFIVNGTTINASSAEYIFYAVS